MAPSWLACCAVREAGDEVKSITSCMGDEDLFFDCAETWVQLTALRHPGSFAALSAEDNSDLQEDGSPGHSGCCCSELPDLTIARAVLERTHEEWSKRLSELTTVAGPEMEWADLSAAKRMLLATNIDVPKAVEMFVQALEFRMRYRELFETLHCQTCADLRVVARDLEAHPTIYMCARSLTAPLRTIRDQFVVTFEAACRLTKADGRVVFVVDMHGMRPHLYMDFTAIKELAETLGTVFAERIFRIVIVDFSRAAQAAWWMLKPLLSQRTRDKFAFVTHSQAKELCRSMFSTADYESICSSFAINRDPNSSDAQRELHARRTTLCSVPLGPPLK